MGFFRKLQKKWKVSFWQMIVILIIFALTGTTVLFIKQPILWLIGFGGDENSTLKTILYLLLILPVYQILLLFYAFIFGQFSFFWTKFKKLIGFIVFIFSSKKN